MYKSQFEKQPQFVAPEQFGEPWDMDSPDLILDLGEMSSWDIAIRYHELKSKAAHQDHIKNLRAISARAVLERAQALLGSITHPVQPGHSPLNEVPQEAQRVEIDLDETLDQSPVPFLKREPITSEDLWSSFEIPKTQNLVLAIDTSLSMTGEKLALTAVALAVVLLQFPNDPIGIVAFENSAKTLKKPLEKISIKTLVERFLDVPAQGYTHLEAGLLGAMSLTRQARTLARGARPSTLLLSDGKYTAGRDPSYLAPRFKHLVVLKMGKEKASLPLCAELAQKGHGSLVEVGELRELPKTMYNVVKDLLRR